VIAEIREGVDNSSIRDLRPLCVGRIWNCSDSNLEELQRSRVHPLTPPRSQNGMSTQPGFFLQSIERNLLQTLSQSLFRRACVLLVTYKRRQQCANIFRLLPSSRALQRCLRALLIGSP